MKARAWIAAGVVGGTVLAAAGTMAHDATKAARRVFPLDGTWEVAEGAMDRRPERFDHTVPVPGLVDMANPVFATYVHDAFAPVGLMIDAWAEEYPGGQAREFPVVVINDLYEAWNGEVRFRVLRDGLAVQEKRQPCEVGALGDTRLTFEVDIPSQSGSYQLEAALMKPGESPVRSLRDFQVPAKSGR